MAEPNRNGTRPPVVGAGVLYIDAEAQPHAALVTAVWGSPRDVAPSCNLVIVSTDPRRTDTMGRQLERVTSIVHRSRQPGPTGYWQWPHEPAEARVFERQT